MISKITLKQDTGDGWICSTDYGDAFIYSSIANDYPDEDTLLAALVPNRDTNGPKWFVSAALPSDTHVTQLNGIHGGGTHI